MSVLKELLKNLVSRPVTIKYPQERKEPPSRFRGRLQMNYDKCTGCGLCERNCPALAITLVSPKGVSEIRARRPLFRLYECVFCGQCALSCPVKAISFTREYELATYEKQGLTLYPPWFKSEKRGDRD